MRYLLVSGGTVSDTFVADVIKQGGYDVVLAVDSGMDCLYRIGILPDIIVGDFDSVIPETLNFFWAHEQIDMCMLQPEKDDTDTEFAIREAIRRGANEITIVGGTGTRLDHVLGNITLLGIGLEEKISMEMLDEHNRIRMVDEPLTIRREEQYGRYLSLIPITEQVTSVTLCGVKYPLSDYTMGGFHSLGISNEIVDDEASISFSDGKLLVIESKD